MELEKGVPILYNNNSLSKIIVYKSNATRGKLSCEIDDCIQKRSVAIVCTYVRDLNICTYVHVCIYAAQTFKLLR